MRALHRLTATEVKKAGPGKYADGGGLWLFKSRDGAGKWVFRYTHFGRRREMGLGSAATVSLKQARELAARWREVTNSGQDPIKLRDAEAKSVSRADTSLRAIAEEAFEARKAELKRDGKAGRWFSPLELHILPKLGKTPVEEIDQRDIREVLAPIWHTKADTARKALGRLLIVLKHATALGLDVDLQATVKAKALLGQTRHQGKHIDALSWQEVPDFYASLDEPTITHLSLRLLILTGMRSRPIRYLRLEQLEGDIWTVPGEEMKGRKGRTPDFRVPLSTEAQHVIALAKPYARDGYLFPSARKGVISDATMARLMERRGMSARPHGFRSSLRVWLAEQTDASHEISERILGHSVGTPISRAYQRSDQIEQRRVLLQAWNDYISHHDR
jgi:integrase